MMKMIKQETGEMKAATIDECILGDEKFCLKLFPDAVAHFMTIGQADELSKLIRNTIDVYFAEKQAGQK